MTKLRFHTVLICAALVLAPLASAAQDSEKPLANVAGQPIYEQDLMSVAGPSLLDLHKQEYKVKSEALDKVIRKKIIEVEANKRGVSTEELLKQEVDSKVSEPSDDEAKGYYLAVKAQTTLPFEDVKEQVKQLIKNIEIQQAREKYADSLRAKTEISILIEQPSVQVAYDEARVKGDIKAPVTIIEFSDFQCPYCKKSQSVLNEVLAKYRGQVKLAFRDFPLRQIHPDAQNAAEAARCAGEQGKFWEFHDALFADQSKLKEADLIANARTLGLNEKAFQSCLSSGKFKTKVDADVQEGSNAGVSGAPGFFINGIFLSGAQPRSEFEKIIDTQLSLARNRAKK